LLSGVPVHVVSRRLGHADVQTTLQLYAHVTEGAGVQAAAQWQAFTAGWRAGADDAALTGTRT
jgi:integrase